MKNFARTISMICSIFLFNTFLYAQLPSAEGTRAIERKTIREDDVRNLKSDDLIDLYDRVLHETPIWAAGEIHKLSREIIGRNEPDLDQRLVVLAKRVIHEEATGGLIDSFGVKKPMTRTERILELLGRRRTKITSDYILSQITSQYPVVRSCVVSALGRSGMIAGGDKELILRIAPLLHDKKPQVSYRSAHALSDQITGVSPISEHAIRALVEARDKTAKGGPIVNGYSDLRGSLDRVIEDCRMRLTESLEKAGLEEKKELNRLLEILGSGN